MFFAINFETAKPNALKSYKRFKGIVSMVG